MSQELAQIIEDECDQAGLEFRSGYSGHGMCGRKCVGMVGDMGELALALMSIGSRIEESSAGWPSSAAWDSMGLDSIVYFPGITADDWSDS